MNPLHRLLFRLEPLFRKRAIEDALSEEIRTHLEMQVEANMKAGMSPDEARDEALREFGWVESVKENYRDERGVRWVEDLVRDMRYAIRSLCKTPAVTVIAVLVLAVGIGACAAMFSVTNAVLLQPLPYARPERLVQVGEDPSGKGTDRSVVSGGCFEDWRTRCKSFEHIAALWRIEANLTGSKLPERLVGAQVSASFFDVLGVRPAIGRAFLPDEERPGNERVVVVTDELWQERYAGASDLHGKILELSGQSYAIVGVLPHGFSFVARDADFWIPFAWGSEAWHASREDHRLRVFGRLAPNISPGQAQAELATVVETQRADYPFWKKHWGATVVPLQESFVGGVRPLLLMLMGAVGFVLLIVCANVATLMLVRGIPRQRELAVRTALGASRRRIIQQLLVEALALSLTGGLLGTILAYWSRDILVAISPHDLPRIQEVTMDLRVLAMSIGVAVVTGVVSGIVPAWSLSRTHLEGTLREGGRGSSSAGAPHRIAAGLVVAEVATAVLLLVGAGLFLGSLRRLYSVDPGIDTHNVLTLQLSLSDHRYPQAADGARFFREALEHIEALPGVVSAGACTSVPFRGPSMTAAKLDGHPNSEYFQADYGFATSRYFDALGIPLIRGRLFGPADEAPEAASVIVNEAFVRQSLPDADPIGRRVALAHGPVLEIVGVVGDTRDRSVTRAPVPHCFQPIGATTWNDFHIFVRTAVEPRSLDTAVRRAVLAVDSDQPVASVRTLDEVLADSVGAERFMMVLSGSFAVVALVLAAIAVFGVVSCSVNRRRREFGVRLALGAQPAAVFALTVRQGMTMVWIGLAIGLAATLALSHVLRQMLFDISPTDPMTITAVILVLSGAALLACWLPARRAARVDPMVALRAE